MRAAGGNPGGIQGGKLTFCRGAAGVHRGLPRPGWLFLLILGTLPPPSPAFAQGLPATGPRQPLPRVSRPGAESAKPTAGTASGPGASPSAAETASDTPAAQGQLMDRIADFIKDHPVLIVVGLAAGIAGSLLFLFLSARRQGAGGGEDEVELYPLRGVQEDEGPRRVLIDPDTGLAKEMPKRDESEYALVVNEEELLIPHSTEAGTSGAADSESAIEELVEKHSFDEAYDRYRKRLHDHALSTFKPEAERRMAKYFLKKGDFEKAGHILEHHLATQPASEVEPEVYFDLGYIHFKSKTLPKCKRYFRLFAEKADDPSRSERARRLLADLEKIRSLN